MNASNLRVATATGLALGAVGILILWASGIAFPIYPPPGAIILTAGTILVALARWRWVGAVGVALGLFIVVGFLASPTGIDNLTGGAGAGAALGSALQLAGVLIAIVAGVLAVVAGYRRSAG